MGRLRLANLKERLGTIEQYISLEGFSKVLFNGASGFFLEHAEV